MISLVVEVLIDDDAEPDLSAWFHGVDAASAAITSAVRAAAVIEGCDRGLIGVRICNDAAIHPINRQFLQHDYPTDVISFPYAFEPPMVEGELVVSYEAAIANASEPNHPLTPRDELLLYVIHGTLHLVGHDDQSDEPRARMRDAEAAAMAALMAVRP